MLNKLWRLLLMVSLLSGMQGGSYGWAQNIQQFNYDRAAQNFQAVRTGTKKFEQLTPHEQTEVLALIRAMSRSRAPKDTSDCRDAWDRAKSAADELASTASRLKRCAVGADFSDDCYGEMRRTKSAHDDYESAVSSVRSDCH